MEYLTPTVSFDIFMDDYFTSLRLLNHLGVNKIWATDVLNKSRLRKCTIVGDKQLQKRNVATLNSAYQAKKQCNFDSGWLEQQQGGLLNLVKLRGLLGVGTKLNESMFKNNQINSAVTTRTWVLLAEETRTWPGTGVVSEWKMVIVPVCLSNRCCSSGCVGVASY